MSWFHIRQPTLSLYEDPKQWVRCGHCLAEVVVIVNWQQVTVDVSIADHHLHICNAMDMKDEFVELFKFAGLDSVHWEPTELCPILKEEQKKKKDIKETTKQEEETARSDLLHLSQTSEWHIKLKRVEVCQALSQRCHDLRRKLFLSNKQTKWTAHICKTGLNTVKINFFLNICILTKYGLQPFKNHRKRFFDRTANHHYSLMCTLWSRFNVY